MPTTEELLGEIAVEQALGCERLVHEVMALDNAFVLDMLDVQGGKRLYDIITFKYEEALAAFKGGIHGDSK